MENKPKETRTTTVKIHTFTVWKMRLCEKYFQPQIQCTFIPTPTHVSNHPPRLHLGPTSQQYTHNSLNTMSNVQENNFNNMSNDNIAKSLFKIKTIKQCYKVL